MVSKNLVKDVVSEPYKYGFITDIETEKIEETLNEENKLSDEIQKLDQLLKDGVLTQEEFEKAKKKLLDN